VFQEVAKELVAHKVAVWTNPVEGLLVHEAVVATSIDSATARLTTFADKEISRLYRIPIQFRVFETHALHITEVDISPPDVLITQIGKLGQAWLEGFRREHLSEAYLCNLAQARRRPVFW
jgi:hypothetical protein